ncbi:hypothetical protein [Actinophytocola oryzae]|uniref:Hsp70 protein n=1 Tax=Actinophytocola oryzae TaxID=502181 RepID=A0A4R7UXY3_9PSEU|nr:hypothetical protein [Actinophytocola oryzae]TDV40977.1 hypothetical protein CLV71_12143 [Actinophytocola oryzae]
MAELDLGVDLGMACARLAVLDRRGVPVAPLRDTAVPDEDLGVVDDRVCRFVSAVLRAPADDRDGRAGVPRRSVVAVPHSWLGGDPSPAALLEGRLCGADDTDGRVVSQPVAAAAHLCRRDPRLVDVPLVLCDLGATALRIAVCRVTSTRVALLSHTEVTRSFDVDTALAEYAIRRGSRVAPARVDARLLRRTIAAARAGLVPEEEAELWAGRRELFGREPYVTAGAYTLTYDDAAAATEALTTAAGALAREVRATRAELTDGGPWRLALLGGGALFVPLRRAVLAGMGAETGGRVLDLDRDTVLRAAACGAALVAGGLLDPGDRYPHEVSLAARQVSGGVLRPVEVLLARPGELHAGGRSLPGRGVPAPVHFDGRDVELVVRDRGGVSHRVRRPVPEELKGGTFAVALRQLATGECVLVCRSGDRPRREWDLGVLPVSGTGG